MSNLGKTLLLALLFTCTAASAAAAEDRFRVQLITDEAEAVLKIAQEHADGATIAETEWDSIMKTEAYQRLMKREQSFHRDFTDAQFREFVLSTQLVAKLPSLKQALVEWKKADLDAAAKRALAYLPGDAVIHAKAYVMIKPRENSFVWEPETDPAIFLALDPAKTSAQVENIIAHEFHHIGFANSKSTKALEDDTGPEEKIKFRSWLSAFGEGFAMLAAAGGPDVHPHAVSNPEDHVRWDHDVANFNHDVEELDHFFADILSGKLKGDAVRDRGMTYFGVQGPWYTVGWKMAVVIEKTYGRKTLIECMQDRSKLLPTYNRAATEWNAKSKDKLTLWSDTVANALTKTK